MERRLWKFQEDEVLRTLVLIHGLKSWTFIANRLQTQFSNFNRNGKQCRERWLNHLSSSQSKKQWRLQDCQSFINLYRKFGNRWSQLAKHMQGRTQNSIKNFFYSNMRKFSRLIVNELKLRKIKSYRYISQNYLSNLINNVGVTSNDHLELVLSFISTGLKNCVLKVKNLGNQIEKIISIVNCLAVNRCRNGRYKKPQIDQVTQKSSQSQSFQELIDQFSFIGQQPIDWQI